MIKTGLIGHGYWGKIIESKLRMVSDLKFIQTSKNYDPGEFKNVDWLFIATPVHTHYKIAKDGIDNGVNIFLEKPATDTVEEYINLIELAKTKEVNLYVSNVFLFRGELKVKVLNSSVIRFLWYKNSGFNDSLLNDLLYHDPYILIHILGKREIGDVIVYVNQKDKMRFTFEYGNTFVLVDYDRESEVVNKSILFGGQLVNFPITNKDPLLTMINECLLRIVSFEKNYKLNRNTLILFDVIKQKLNDNTREN